MGYLVQFEFETIDEPTKGSFIEALKRVVEYDGFRADHPTEHIKWYSHEQDIVTAMKISGASEVSVHGEGENQGDVWDKIFRLKDGGSTKFYVVEIYKYKLVRDQEPILKEYK